MTCPLIKPLRAPAFLRRFWRDQRGANAVEFAVLALPFIMLLLFILQIGLFNLTKNALDIAVTKQSETLQTAFASTTAPVLPSATAMKASIAANSGGLVANSNLLSVEVQPLQNLGSGAVAISDGLANYGTAKTVLAIRASYVWTSFVPGISASVTAYSSALVRRQNQ